MLAPPLLREPRVPALCGRPLANGGRPQAGRQADRQASWQAGRQAIGSRRSNRSALSSLLLGSTAVSARDGVVARLDGGGAPRRAAIAAAHDVEPGGGVPREVRVRALAHLARHELLDVLPEQALCVLLLVRALEDELPLRGDRAF